MKRTRATDNRRLQLQKVEIKELAATNLEQVAGGGRPDPFDDNRDGNGIRTMSSRTCL